MCLCVCECLHLVQRTALRGNDICFCLEFSRLLPLWHELLMHGVCMLTPMCLIRFLHCSRNMRNALRFHQQQWLTGLTTAPRPTHIARACHAAPLPIKQHATRPECLELSLLL